MENVQQFASYDKGLILQHSLKILLNIGYQVTYGVLQAGQYGAAQNRERLIILAAAPGEKLPRMPEPSHAFRDSSGPLRTVTAWDILSDLPPIPNGHNQVEMSYGGEEVRPRLTSRR